MSVNVETEQALQSLLAEARAEADQLRERKEQYERILLSTRLLMAHELKKPATAISGYLDLAMEGGSDETNVASYLAKAREQCLLLNELNAFFLSLLKIDRPLEPIEGTPVSLRDIIQDILRQMPAALRTPERVTVKIASDIHRFTIHPNAFRIIISNLVENALKYSDGEVSIEIQKQPDKRAMGQRDLIHIVVSDAGNGIPEQYAQRVFVPFVRLRPDKDGAGLGLTLVRSLVEMSSGSIHIRGGECRGTTVQVTIPEMVSGEAVG